jgi:hypothetical protein
VPKKLCPDHWGGPIGPKLCEPSTYVILFWCASKKSHFQTFTQLNPSGRIHAKLLTFGLQSSEQEGKSAVVYEISTKLNQHTSTHNLNFITQYSDGTSLCKSNILRVVAKLAQRTVRALPYRARAARTSNQSSLKVSPVPKPWPRLRTALCQTSGASSGLQILLQLLLPGVGGQRTPS